MSRVPAEAGGPRGPGPKAHGQRARFASPALHVARLRGRPVSPLAGTLLGVKLLHTADWQIGMRAAQCGRAAERVREARLRAAERVIALANEQRVDAVILAGDTFEDSSVPRDLVRRVADVLRRSEAPVFVLPGNHDPLVPRGVFDHLAWDDARPRVTVFRDRKPVAIGDADLFPCPLRRASSVEDP